MDGTWYPANTPEPGRSHISKGVLTSRHTSEHIPAGPQSRNGGRIDTEEMLLADVGQSYFTGHKVDLESQVAFLQSLAACSMMDYTMAIWGVRRITVART